MTTLRSSILRLAHANPELRSHLIPILKEAALGDPMSKDAIKDMGHVMKSIMETMKMVIAAMEEGDPESAENSLKMVNDHVKQGITQLKEAVRNA